MELKNRELEAASKKAQQAIDDANEKARKAIEKKTEEADKKISDTKAKNEQKPTSVTAAATVQSDDSTKGQMEEIKQLKDLVANLVKSRRDDSEKQATAV